MQQTISTVSDIKQKIEAGRKLLLAGDEDALRQLPKGDWIAGTIPYFISGTEGGMVSREMICATDITDCTAGTRTRPPWRRCDLEAWIIGRP